MSLCDKKTCAIQRVGSSTPTEGGEGRGTGQQANIDQTRSSGEKKGAGTGDQLLIVTEKGRRQGRLSKMKCLTTSESRKGKIEGGKNVKSGFD